MVTQEDPGQATVTGSGEVDGDAPLLARLRLRDEQAFATLVDRYHARLVRLAIIFVPNQAVAEEVAQETWIAVLQGIDRFEARSSFRTWLFRILTNQAKRRGQREARSLPFAAFSPRDDAEDTEGGWCAVAPERFLPSGHEWAGHWMNYPQDWRVTPEEVLLSNETQAIIQKAIMTLPLNQRRVITLRDVEGFPAAEVCAALEITETYQRVLLHRARSKVRAHLDQQLEGRGVTTVNRDELACQELVEIVTDYLEGALPDGERELFDAHLAECEGCRRYLDQMLTTIRLTGTLNASMLDPGARNQLLQLFHDWSRN